jgi:hypothetical protein
LLFDQWQIGPARVHDQAWNQDRRHHGQGAGGETVRRGPGVDRGETERKAALEQLLQRRHRLPRPIHAAELSRGKGREHFRR